MWHKETPLCQEGELGRDRDRGSNSSSAIYLLNNPWQGTLTFRASISFHGKRGNNIAPSYLRVVLKVKASNTNEMHCKLWGTTQMSSYFRYEALYEKCGCPGSPSESQEGQKGWSRVGKGRACCPEKTESTTVAKSSVTRTSKDSAEGSSHPTEGPMALVCSSKPLGIKWPHLQPTAPLALRVDGRHASLHGWVEGEMPWGATDNRGHGSGPPQCASVPPNARLGLPAL